MGIKDSNLTIMVRSMDKSIEFYTSLGLQVTNRYGNHYAQLAAPGITIGLHPATEESGRSSGTTSIGFTTDDFDGARTLLESMSVNIASREEEAGKFLHFSDPDGTALYFMKPNLYD
jgi:catechol 2,3-dioxygenase-like lactoylglutathione lyase family enzyme